MILQEKAWKRGLTLAEQPTASYTPPDECGPYYQKNDMGVLHLEARAWRRLDADEEG